MTYKTVKLGEYLYIKGRIGWKGLKKDEYLASGEYRIINGETLTADGIDWDKTGYITERRYEESPEIMLQEGESHTDAHTGQFIFGIKDIFFIITQVQDDDILNKHYNKMEIIG